MARAAGEEHLILINGGGYGSRRREVGYLAYHISQFEGLGYASRRPSAPLPGSFAEQSKPGRFYLTLGSGI
jgi:hypothetical protein